MHDSLFASPILLEAPVLLPVALGEDGPLASASRIVPEEPLRCAVASLEHWLDLNA